MSRHASTGGACGTSTTPHCDGTAVWCGTRAPAADCASRKVLRLQSVDSATTARRQRAGGGGLLTLTEIVGAATNSQAYGYSTSTGLRYCQSYGDFAATTFHAFSTSPPIAPPVHPRRRHRHQCGRTGYFGLTNFSRELRSSSHGPRSSSVTCRRIASGRAVGDAGPVRSQRHANGAVHSSAVPSGATLRLRSVAPLPTRA